jgi:hypothetical protein
MPFSSSLPIFEENQPKLRSMNYLRKEPGISNQAQSRLIKANQGIFGGQYACYFMRAIPDHFSQDSPLAVKNQGLIRRIWAARRPPPCPQNQALNTGAPYHPKAELRSALHDASRGARARQRRFRSGGPTTLPDATTRQSGAPADRGFLAINFLGKDETELPARQIGCAHSCLIGRRDTAQCQRGCQY